MSRIAERFAQLKSANRTALIPYITAGDPEPGVTVKTMHAMVEAGADIIELGVPFSDPMADGPVIQKAAERALVHGTSLRDVLSMVRRFREQDSETPVVLMGYLNPIEIMGYEHFVEQAVDAGVDGVLTVDLPPEEAEVLLQQCQERGLDPIFLITPTSSAQRIESITALASGFVYYVSVKGITGAGNLDVDAVAGKVATIRKATELPVGVGFGIKDAESASKIGAVADAVIVGSAVVNRVEALQQSPEKIPAELGAFIAELRSALD